MNILLYLHKTDLFGKIAELLNIVSAWKKSEKNSNIYVAMPKEKGLSIKDELKQWDLDKIFLLETSEENPIEEGGRFLKKILQEEDIDCIVMGNSIYERELAPYTASICNWKFIPNIINFELQDKNIIWKRFLYGTKAVEEIVSGKSSIVVTISSNIYKKDERNQEKDIKNIEVIDIESDKSIDDSYILKSRERKMLQKHPLETAKIVVGVGKGIKGKENFPMIEELADLLGATVGVTRSVVDNGWRPEYEKIGQTGKIIKPELYLGFGISGAMQHMAGVQQSRHIIMVNSNPNAESFRSSDFGIVADLFNVVPRIIEYLKGNTEK